MQHRCIQIKVGKIVNNTATALFTCTRRVWAEATTGTGEDGKSEIAWDRLRQPSTNQIAPLTRATPATYQSYIPDGRNHPAYIAHRTRTRTHKNAQHTAAHATIYVRSRHRTNPRSTRCESGKASEHRRRPRRYHVDPLSRRREVAHGVRRSSLKPEQTISFAIEEGSRFFCRPFSTHQPTIHLRSRYKINSRSKLLRVG